MLMSTKLQLLHDGHYYNVVKVETRHSSEDARYEIRHANDDNTLLGSVVWQLEHVVAQDWRRYGVGSIHANWLRTQEEAFRWALNSLTVY